MIDFHTHILPQMDDGAKDLGCAVNMLKNYNSDDLVVLSPHFYPWEETPESFLERREKAYETLLQAKNQNNFPHFLKGAEVYYFDGICTFDNLKSLAIEGTSLLLLEMPYGRWTSRQIENVGKIKALTGITPVIAHIERYIPLQRFSDNIKNLSELSVYVQINTSYVLNRSYSALKMLRQGKAQFLGSDCHDDKGHSPNLKKAIELVKNKLGEQFVLQLEDNQNKIIQNHKEIKL